MWSVGNTTLLHVTNHYLVCREDHSAPNPHCAINISRQPHQEPLFPNSLIPRTPNTSPNNLQDTFDQHCLYRNQLQNIELVWPALNVFSEKNNCQILLVCTGNKTLSSLPPSTNLQIKWLTKWKNQTLIHTLVSSVQTSKDRFHHKLHQNFFQSHIYDIFENSPLPKQRRQETSLVPLWELFFEKYFQKIAKQTEGYLTVARPPNHW